MGISWLQRARDYGRLSAAANELLTLVSQRNVGELEGLIDLLGPQFEGFGGLGFLHRFDVLLLLLLTVVIVDCEFHHGRFKVIVFPGW